jgi:hypothetical protein
VPYKLFPPDRDDVFGSPSEPYTFGVLAECPRDSSVGRSTYDVSGKCE